MKCIHKVCALTSLSFSLYASSQLENIFDKYYQSGTWDESGFSKSGSPISVMQPYVDFVQDFLINYEIRSVVDVGCGDWAFSRYVDWGDIEYLGIDIVKMVVERNQELFAQSNITFIHGDALKMDLPEVDLLICKDTFQHLSNANIQRFLKQIHKYKHCLFTDYVDRRTLSSTNIDIHTGFIHSVDVSKPPFNLNAKRALIFQGVGAPKQTLHIERARVDQYEPL